MRRLEIPGVAVGILYNGREYTSGFGITSIENPLPVTRDTLFQVGSITKTFTGTMVMQLVEQGKIDLDAPVRKYIKDFRLRDREVQRRVTVRHLLTHTGGWVGDYFNEFGNGDDALARMVKDIAHLKQVQPLGTIWSYNNTGFNVAAHLIEVVTNMPYEEAAHKMLLDPLGLKMTYFFPSDMLITHRFVVGHHRKNKKLHVSRPWAVGRAGNGVGGVVSTVRDLLSYGQFHMSRGNGIIKRQTLESMRVPQVDAGGRGIMGITWFIRGSSPLTRYSHGGATHGQQAIFMFIPEKKFVMSVLTNSDDGGILNNNAMNSALELYFNFRAETPRTIRLSGERLEEYTGSYRIGTEAFDLTARQGHLVYHHIPLGGFPNPDSPPGPARPRMRFAFYEPDHVIGLDEPLKDAIGDFIRGRNGRIRYFRVGGRAHLKTA
jgi:CubicO group peptidase (beta-lactamase class C family)